MATVLDIAAKAIRERDELLVVLEDTLRQLKTATSNWTDDVLNNLIIGRAEALISKVKGE